MSKLYYNLYRKDPEAYARTVKWLKDFGDRRALAARAARNHNLGETPEKPLLICECSSVNVAEEDANAGVASSTDR